MTYNSSNGTILAAAVQGEMTFICVEFAETSQGLFAQAKWMSRCCFEVKLASRAGNFDWIGGVIMAFIGLGGGDRPSTAAMGLAGTDKGPCSCRTNPPAQRPQDWTSLVTSQPSIQPVKLPKEISVQVILASAPPSQANAQSARDYLSRPSTPTGDWRVRLELGLRGWQSVGK